jgi:acetyl-CoA acetyltransferase
MSTTERVAVSGIGESAIGATPNKTSTDLHVDACLAAIDDAGLAKKDIDGVLTGYSLVDPSLMHSTKISESLGIQPDYNASLMVGGATPFVGVCHAAAAIRQGQCENVLVAFGDNRKTGFMDTDGSSELANMVGHPEFEDPFGPTVPALYALIAQRHMAEFGTTREDLARVAVACRRHAARRGTGQQTEPIDVADVKNSKPIAEPLNMLDCALISDCAGAVVVSSAASGARCRDPVELIGFGEGHGSKNLLRRPELVRSPANRSGETAFEMADLTPEAVDVAQLYDCFTITPLVLLEDLGFCDRGASGRFVQEEGITVGETLPVNTHGGELSYAGAGVFHIIEAVRQLRGDGGSTQVDNVETALAHGVGGVLSTNATLLMGEW